jgi:alpha-1,3-glucosyltransferase
VLALVVRAATGLHPHSGEGTPPQYGDYEAQRHWMELAVALPPHEWYRASPDNDLSYWGLDYPPISGYASYVAGRILYWIEPKAVAWHTSRGFESPLSRAAMRASVLAGDAFVLFPALAAFLSCSGARNGEKIFAFTLSIPALMLIDHAHFQYNGVSLGLFIASVAAMATECTAGHMLGSILFCMSVCFKQMNLYYAPAIAAYLLSTMAQRRPLRSAIPYAFSIAACILITTCIIFLPWLRPWSLPHVLSRIFPVSRGLFEDKVANLWCSLSVAVKLDQLLSKGALVKLCTAATLAACTPFCIAVACQPTIRQLLLSSTGCALSAYLFSFHVHEKQILIPLIPLALLADSLPAVALWSSLTAGFSLFPLLDREGLIVAYFILMIGHIVIADSMLSVSLLPTVAWKRNSAVCAFAAGLLLHALKAFGPAVSSKPDIYVVMMTTYACAHFCCLYFVLLYYSVVD